MCPECKDSMELIEGTQVWMCTTCPYAETNELHEQRVDMPTRGWHTHIEPINDFTGGQFQVLATDTTPTITVTAEEVFRGDRELP